MAKKDLYQDYIEVSNKLSELTLKKEVLGKMIMHKFELEKLDKIEAPNGLITRVSRATWKYPESIKTSITKLQEACKADGTAQKVESEFLKVSLR